MSKVFILLDCTAWAEEPNSGIPVGVHLNLQDAVHQADGLEQVLKSDYFISELEIGEHYPSDGAVWYTADGTEI